MKHVGTNQVLILLKKAQKVSKCWIFHDLPKSRPTKLGWLPPLPVVSLLVKALEISTLDPEDPNFVVPKISQGPTLWSPNGVYARIFNWAVLSDEQMSNGWPYSLLNDEQMSNKVRVEHQPVKDGVIIPMDVYDVEAYQKKQTTQVLVVPFCRSKKCCCFPPVWRKESNLILSGLTHHLWIPKPCKMKVLRSKKLVVTPQK